MRMVLKDARSLVLCITSFLMDSIHSLRCNSSVLLEIVEA